MTQKFHNLAVELLDWLIFSSSLWTPFSGEKVYFIWSTKNSKFIFTRKVSGIFSPTELLYSLKTAESALYEPNLYFKVTNKTFNFQNTITYNFFF